MNVSRWRDATTKPGNPASSSMTVSFMYVSRIELDEQRILDDPVWIHILFDSVKDIVHTVSVSRRKDPENAAEHTSSDGVADRVAGGTRGWTLQELTGRVREALEDQGLVQKSGRVRDLPDGRTIRYYTTLGLLDRPLGVRHRRKLYGERHRQQLVAIKRLQAEKLSLAQVQERLLSADPGALADLARAPGPAPLPAGEAARAPFWKVRDPGRRPGRGAAHEPGSGAGSRNTDERATSSAPGSAITRAAALQVSGLTLVFASTAALTPEDLEAVQQAAGPLLETLRQRGLLTS